MDNITQAFTEFARFALDEGYTDKNCMDYLYKLNDDFRTNEIANNIFPLIFNIEQIKRKEMEKVD